MTWRYITLITCYHLPLLSLHLLIFLIPSLRLITFTRVTSQCIFTPCNFPFTPNPTTRETPDSFRWISDTPRSGSFSFPWITQAKRHLGATGDPHTRRLPAFLAKAKTSAKKKKKIKHFFFLRFMSHFPRTHFLLSRRTHFPQFSSKDICSLLY